MAVTARQTRLHPAWVAAGVIRDTTGQYTMAWVGAAFVSTRVGRAAEPVSP
jgi:hypothetical protein